ncbi:MAG: hypothetical protein NTW06_02110, partial [Candidatus Falkowbacteria bacterium]|nr:hypothetical protein [Candidatus Falkowbacteria bacterium]
KRDPLLFKKAWQDNKKMREEIIATGFSAHLERDHFPIFIYQKEDKFNVIDGMRRTLLNIIKGKNKIKAWVGYEKNKKGQPLISANRCLFLSDIYTIADKKDKELEKAIIRIGREIITDYSNGRDILIKRIAGWSRDPEIKRIFKKIK